ncbi:MAG: C45 family autoproteolytic acyltransferase/hydrolase [Candidatus Hodarchaeales archaeon]|jgi:hypothetical protein
MIKPSLLLEVTGTPYEIGQMIGRSFAERIHDGFNESTGARWLFGQDEINPAVLNEAAHLGKQFFPDYMEEIKGIADGSCMEYRKILAVNFMHVLFTADKNEESVEDCSTAIFKYPSKTLICHNEDLDPVLGKYSYFLHYRKEKSSFLAHAYCGCIPGLSFGFNSRGIVKCCNSLPDPYKKQGIPRILFGRAVLGRAKTLAEAVAITQQHSPRGGGVSYNLVSMNDNQAVNVETTSLTAATTPITDRYFRTNHYISDGLKRHPLPLKVGCSVERYKAGMEYVRKVDKNKQGIMKILADPVVFVTPERTGGIFCTVCTVVIAVDKSIKLEIYQIEQENEFYQTFSSENLFKRL